MVGDLAVVGPTAQDPICPHARHTCHASDMNYLVLAPDHVPWGRLNVIDMGVGGYRTLKAGTEPLTCSEIAIGDRVEMNGRNIYRTGTVTEKGQNLQPPDRDGSYFPCMVVATVQVGGGDSGSVVMVRDLPAGVTSRTFDGNLGFTPLAEGLAQLGLELCTTPACDLR